MFTYFIPLTVNLTKNSKLEKFVHELNALWKLSGSSMGALRELVAVAGILSDDALEENCSLHYVTLTSADPLLIHMMLIPPCTCDIEGTFL